MFYSTIRRHRDELAAFNERRSIVHVIDRHRLTAAPITIDSKIWHKTKIIPANGDGGSGADDGPAATAG